MFVLDASALLALVLEERGADRVRDTPAGSEMSVINLGEVLTRLTALGRDPEEALERILRMPIRIRKFREEHALAVARLRPVTAHLGLSFGDRACLAQAQFSLLPVLTADSDWAKLDIGVEIILIR